MKQNYFIRYFKTFQVYSSYEKYADVIVKRYAFQNFSSLQFITFGFGHSYHLPHFKTFQVYSSSLAALMAEKGVKEFQNFSSLQFIRIARAIERNDFYNFKTFQVYSSYILSNKFCHSKTYFKTFQVYSSQLFFYNL